MPYKLKNLVVDRCDLVDVGANLDRRTGDGAHIMLFKRGADPERGLLWRVVDLAKARHASAGLIAKAEAAARSFDQILAGQRARRALDSLWDLYYAFMEAAQSIFASDEADKIGLLKDSAIDFMNAFLAALPEAVEEGDEVEMAVAKVGRKISGKRMQQLRDMHEKLGALLKEVSEGDDAMKLAEFAKSLGVAVAESATDEQIQKAINDHITKQVADGIAKGAKPADVAEAVQKALDAQKATFEAELAKRDERITKAELVAKAEKDLRILKQFDDQARGEFAGLGLSLEKKTDAPAGSKTDAEIFKALSEKAPEEWARVSAILKGAAEAIRLSKMFEEEGSGGTGSASTAEGQILQLAKALVEKGSEKTMEQAIAKIATDPAHSELYRRYSDEQREKAKH